MLGRIKARIKARITARITALGLLLATASCDGSFQVHRAPGFPKAPGATLSVFGVYRDGRLAPEAWDVFRPHLTPMFGVPSCEPGYPDMLNVSGPPVIAAIDDYSRANGVTDELMDKLAPMAKGDFVLLLVVNGRPGKPTTTSGPDPQSAPPPVRGGGRHGTPSSGAAKTTTDSNTFETAAIVFSTKAHHSVGAIRMNYTGTSVDEALEQFMTRLGSELPQATCAGWSGDVHLDASDIRRLAAE